MAIADISKWQGDIDFSQLSKVVDLVILRVQAGSSYADPKYAEYVAGCKQYGIPFGTYAYGKFVSVNDAIQEAKDALARMDKDSKFFALDVEEMTLKIPSDIVPASQAFINYLKQNGVQKVGLYSGQYFYTGYGLSAIQCDFLWLAKYSSNKPSIPCDLWQYSSTGKLDGINTNVDLNVLNGGKPLDYFTGKTVAPVQVSATPLMVVKVLQNTDVRDEPSHASGYVGEALVGQMYNVWQHSGDWHYIIFNVDTNTCGWVDGANGQNLYWLDNPNLIAPTYYKVVSGDTASAIAKKFGVTLAQLKQWNDLNANYTIYAGESIRVK